MDEISRFSDLLELVYDGATRVEVWNDVPRAVCEWMRAPIGLLFTPLNTLDRGGMMVTHNMGPLARELWNTTYHSEDIWVQRGVELGLGVSGSTVRDQELATVEELQATRMYREWFQPQDIGRLLTTVVFGIEQTRQPGVVCALNRPLHRPFDEGELERYRLLSPHLSRALGVMFRLRESDLRLATTLSSLDRLGRAVVLLDRRGKVFHANRVAQDLLQRQDGLTLVRSGREGGGASELSACDPAHQVALDAALRGVIDVHPARVRHFSEVVRIPRAGHVEPYVLQMSPLPAQNEFGKGCSAPVAIVFIDDEPSPHPLDANAMCDRYGLTPAELRVLGESTQGGSVADMAVKLGVSENTVKTHLRRLYGKTGARSRSQLLKLAMASRMRPGHS